MSVRMGKPSAFTPWRMRSPSRNPGPRYASPLVRFALSKDALKTNSPTASRMPRAMRWTCSSLSMTHGPAISTSGRPCPNRSNSIATRVAYLRMRLRLGLRVRLRQRRQPPPPVLIGRADKRFEQRMRLHGLGLELGMELASQKPRMVGNLANLHVRAVRRLSRNPQPGRFQTLFVFAVELIAMPVALLDLTRAIRFIGEARFGEAARPASQPHGAAELVDALQFPQLEYHAVRRAGVELGGIGALQTADVARVFDDQGLHAQADPEVRHFPLAREPDGVQHSVDAALAEAARHQDAVEAFQLAVPLVAHHAFGFDPVDIDL